MITNESNAGSPVWTTAIDEYHTEI